MAVSSAIWLREPPRSTCKRGSSASARKRRPLVV